MNQKQLNHSVRGAAGIFGTALLVAGLTPMAWAGVLPRDTILRARLDDTLSSRESRPGDRFSATISAIDTGQEGARLPEGTRVRGRVTDAVRATKDRPGTLGVEFTRLDLPGGQSVAIDAGLAPIDERSGTVDDQGRFRAKRRSTQTLRFVGYGAAGGALIAAITHGNVVTGGLLGALGGFIYDQIDKSKAAGRDVALRPGAEFGVQLNERVAWGGDRFRSGYGGGRRTRVFSNDDQPGSRWIPNGDGIKVVVDGTDVRLAGTQPTMVDGRVLVPFRGVVERLGADNVDWNPSLRLVTIQRRNDRVELKIGSRQARVNDREVMLDVPPMIIQGSTMVPLRFVSQSLGAGVKWNGVQRTVWIDSAPTTAL
jgi:hypothetical protein